MNSSLLASRWFRTSAVILLIFLGILIGLPYLIKQQARIWLEDNGGDRVEIRDVDFNPFTAELVLEDLLVEVEDRQPLHFDTARLELEWLPLFKKHVDVQAIELQGFYLLVNNEDVLRIGGILLPATEQEPDTQETASEASDWVAGLHTLALKDFTLVYRDAALDEKVYIDSMQLSELKQWDPEAPARLEYRGAVNDAAVEVLVKLAPFAQIPTYKGAVSIDKLSLTDFKSLAKPALEDLAGLFSVRGEFEVEQQGDNIHVVNDGKLEVEALSIKQQQIQLTNQSLDWDGTIDLTLNPASSQTQVKTKGKLTVENTKLQQELLQLANQTLGWDGTMDLTLNPASPQTQVKTKGRLTIENTKLQQELLQLANQALGWDGTMDLTLDPASSQSLVKTKGRLTVEGIDVQHALALLSNESLAWDGATDLTFNTASSQASVNSQGKMTSNRLAADLQEQKLKFAYDKLDLDINLSYGDSGSGTDMTLNSDLLLSGLGLFAPDKKVDIAHAQKLQLTGLEIKGPNHVRAEQITADDLELGRSLEQQQTAGEDKGGAILQAKKVSIGQFSYIDGFTAIDTIVEDDLHVVYHRNKEGEWNAVTLLGALAGEEKDAAATVDGEGEKQTPEKMAVETGEKVAETSTRAKEPEAAAGPPPIAVNRIDVSKGSTATIHDESVNPAFKMTLTVNELFLEKLDGRNPQQTATFKLDGRLDKHSGVQASGDIKPYLQPPEMDIQGKLEAIGLPPLSPYASDSMGVIIDSGSLDVDLKLLSHEQRMKGEAVLLMQQLSVKGTGSKGGLQSKIPVPLDMALNILRDKNDTIKLKIPIEGDANNPSFDVSDAITKAVATGVSAGATSYLVYALQPYGAMVAVAKVAGEAASKIRLDPIKFEPGQASLDDTDRDYLSKIAKVLKERPKIAVKVCGVAVQQDVAHLQPPPAKAGGQTAEKKPPPAGTEVPPATPVVDEQKLTELGEQRAASVKDYLVEQFKVPANRLVNCQPRLQPDKADAIPRTDLLL